MKSAAHRLAVGIFLCACSLALHAQNPAVTVSVDVQTNRHPISPLIYGVNLIPAATANLQDLNSPLNRYGGNSSSTYNWNLNSDNKANDYFFESISDNVQTAGERGDTFITTTKSAGTEPMVTIPMLDWIAQAGTAHPYPCSYGRGTFPNQYAFDPFDLNCGDGLMPDGKTLINGADPNVAYVGNSLAIQQSWVQHIIGNFKTAANGGLKYYILDNEHDLWWETHHDVVATGPHYNEDRDKMFLYAAMIKSQDPGALVVGPEASGWLGYLLSPYDRQYGELTGYAGGINNLPDRKGALNGVDYMPWLLGQFQQYENTHLGQRILDVFTVHYYPAGGPNNINTRSLWDPNYVDPSYINDTVMLIPRMKQWVANNYLGTKIGITEYNWGHFNNEAAYDNMSYAVTQADVLGIFGREGLDLATRWMAPPPNLPSYNAMKMYRNYDGNKSTFGDVSTSAMVPNPDSLAAFSAQRTSDGKLTVMLMNKDSVNSTPTTVNLASVTTASPAQVWQLSAAVAGIQHLADVAVNNSAVSLTLPAQSITLLVIPAVIGDYSFNFANTQQTVFPGQTGSFVATAMAINGYNSLVNINCGTGHPANCPGTTVMPSNAGQQFTVNASDTVVGDYVFNIVGVGTDVANTTHQQQVTLHVVDFGLTQPVPSSVLLGNGTLSQSITFNANAAGVFAGTLAFACNGLPAGATCAFNPPNPKPTANNPVPVTLVINAGAGANGTYPITVSANTAGAPAAKTRPLSLTIGTQQPATDLKVTLTKTLNSMPMLATAPVVSFVFTVENLGAGSNVPANLAVDFAVPVQMGILPAGCSPLSATSIACAFNSTNGTPRPFPIPVSAQFPRRIGVSATVTTTAPDNDPTNDTVNGTANIPPRPFFRNPSPRFP